MAIQHVHSPLTLKGMNLSELPEVMTDRGAWHAAVHGVAKSWTWLSYWTTTDVVHHQFPLLFNVFFSWALQKITEKSLLWWLYIVVAFFTPSSHSLTWHSFFLAGALHKQMFPWARSAFRPYSQEATANSKPFRTEKVFKLFFPVSLRLSAVESVRHHVAQLLGFVRAI